MTRYFTQKTGVKGELILVRTQLADATLAAEKYLEQLSMTENRLERLKSETVQRMAMKPPPVKPQVEAPVKEEELSKPNGNHIIKPEHSPQPLAVCVHSTLQSCGLINIKILQLSNGHVFSIHEDEWKIRVNERDKAINRLQGECNDLAQQLSKARMEVRLATGPRLRS
jgi:hypothetical protein